MKGSPWGDHVRCGDFVHNELPRATAVFSRSNLQFGSIFLRTSFAAALNEFLRRPGHHKYVETIYRRPRVDCNDPENGEIERAICAAMRLKPKWWYVADHIIGENSELHTVCQLPIGKVALARADALEGVRDLIKKQRARVLWRPSGIHHLAPRR
jgi:hypothetical protein